MIEECDMNIPVSRQCQGKQGMIWTVRSFASCQMFLNTKFLSGCPLALLLRTPYTLIAQYKEIKLELIWKFIPCWLAFLVPKGRMQEAREEKNHLSWESYRLQYQPVRQDVSSGAVMAWLLGDNQLHSDLIWGYSKGRSCLVLWMWAKAHGWGDHRL